MTETNITLKREEVVLAALDLAADQAWDSLSLRMIAEKAGVSLPDIHALFDDKTDILTALGRRIDRLVLSGLGPISAETSARDRLFDILMDRFEVLNAHRAGIISILHSFRGDPKQAVIALPHLCRSMTWMLEAAEIDTRGWRGALTVMGLSGVYLKVLKTWMEDESPDLPKTMAALDKALGTAERAANTFRL